MWRPRATMGKSYTGTLRLACHGRSCTRTTRQSGVWRRSPWRTARHWQRRWTVKLWQPGSHRLLATLAGHTSGVWSIALSGDNQLLASSSLDGTVNVWDVETGILRQTLRRARRYERLDITGLTGITEAQRAAWSAWAPPSAAYSGALAGQLGRRSSPPLVMLRVTLRTRRRPMLGSMPLARPATPCPGWPRREREETL